MTDWEVAGVIVVVLFALAVIAEIAYVVLAEALMRCRSDR